MKLNRRPEPSPYETGTWGTPERPCPSEHTLAAHVDGELRGAAAREVESHLDACAACASDHRRLEGLSGLLRAWEQGPGSVGPPPRLLSRVLRDVAPGAGVLRLETVRAGRRAWAAAAAALLAIAGGAALGASGAHEARPTAAFEPVARVHAFVAPDVTRTPGLVTPAPTAHVATPVLDRAPARLLDGTLAAVPEPVFHDTASVEAVAALLPHVATQRRLGEALCVVDGRALPAWAVPAWAEARRADDLLAERARRLGETRTRDPLASGRALADVLPLPAPAGVASFLRSATGAVDAATASRGGVVVTALPRSAAAPATDAGAAPGAEPLGASALDLAAAVAQQKARVLPDGGEGASSVAIEVAAGAPPVYVLAGEVLEGGAGDRVVAQGAWIAAGPAARVVRFACVPVAHGAPRLAGPPVATGLVAGPRIRALLARGESAAGVLVVVEALLDGAALTGPVDAATRSLVSLHRTPSGASWDPEARAAVLLRALGPDAGGFIAADPSGRFQGVEHTTLSGPARDRVLGRLLAGYLAESRARSAADAPRLGVQTETALMRLVEPSVRLLPRRAAAGARVVGDDPRTGVVLEGLSSDEGVLRVLSGFVPDPVQAIPVQGSER